MQKKLITLVFVSILTMTFGSGCFSYGERTEQQDVTPQSYEEHSSVPVLMLPPSPTTQPLVPFQPTSNPALGTPITQAYRSSAKNAPCELCSIKTQEAFFTSGKTGAV